MHLQAAAAATILHPIWGRNRHASLLCCLNSALIDELAVMFEVKYKDSLCWWAIGGQVGREGEVREVGELNDSYTCYSQKGLCCAQHQQWGIWEHTSIDVKSFLTAPMLEGSKLSIWTEMSLRVGVPRTWPTSSLYFYIAAQRTISLPAKVGFQEEEKKPNPSPFCFALFISTLSNLWCTFLFLLTPSRLPRRDKGWMRRLACWDRCLCTFEPRHWGR